MRFYAAIIGPIACWLPLFLFFYISSFYTGAWERNLPIPIQNVLPLFLIIITLSYFPLSAAICGFSASFFLRKECVGSSVESKIQIGFWIRNLFIFVFCFHPFFLCCTAWIVIPLHSWIFDLAFFRGLKFWKSESPEQLFGQYEKPPQAEDSKP